MLEKQLGAEAYGGRLPLAAPAVDEGFVGDLPAQEAVDVESLILTAVSRSVDRVRSLGCLRALRRSYPPNPGREKAGRWMTVVVPHLRGCGDGCGYTTGRRLLCGEKSNQDETCEDDEIAGLVRKQRLENH